MAAPTILAYADRASAAPGETVRFHVSCEGADRYRADIVRLIHGDLHPDGPGFKEELVETAAGGEYPGRVQRVPIGSYVRVEDGGRLGPGAPLTLHALVWPTTPGGREQALLGRYSEAARAGYALVLDADGRLALRVGDGEGVDELAAGDPLLARVWYAVFATLADGRATVGYEPIVSSVNSRLGPTAGLRGAMAEGELRREPAAAPEGFLIAAWNGAEGPSAHFNGKIERPRVYRRALDRAELGALARLEEPARDALVAAWDFAAGIGPDGLASDRVVDEGPHGLDGTCVNMPARAMTGASWTGRVHDFKQAPAEYGAIHFHEDDLDDAGWEADFELVVPDGLRSGVYAARLTADGAEEHAPFVVRPARGRPTAKAVVLWPTATYQAYANDHQGVDAALAQLVLAHTLVLDERDLVLGERRELGLSMYDSHADGSGVCYSSRLRPIVTMRPKYASPIASGPWGFNADLYLIDWLTETGFDFDVVTDEDLHQEGLDLLRPYRALLTGTHPEYWSGAMLDALEGWVTGGGRLMYLGGNGFYWVTEYHPEKPHLIEVRRGNAGIRAWESRPGEHYLATTGELGGLWRHRGRPPQKLAGVGFVTEGLDESSYFRRLPDSREAGAWIFEGVDAEVIGDFGLQGDGAAGLELDRYDLALGTPPDTLLLAASEGHTDQYLLVVEEFTITTNGLGGTQNAAVRGDLVYYTTPGGGAVFSSSSIAWCGALSHDGYDNAVSRVTANVLRQFVKDEPPPTT